MITNLMTNRLTEPLGYALGTVPRLSWEDDQGLGAYWVEVALDEAFQAVVFSSGPAAMNNICYPLENLMLAPRTRYYWRVIAGENCAVSWFETAKLHEPWCADWITPGFPQDWHPELFTAFSVDKPVASARAYVCGLGLYVPYLNGKQVSDECLSPGLCAYDKWLPYQTYDLDGLLSAGENEFCVLLGNGWYKGRYGLDRTHNYRYGDAFACICEISITYKTGETIWIHTKPDTWRARRSHIVASDIFDGEIRDDTLDLAAVYPVEPITIDKSLLTARHSPPISIMRQIKPEAVIHTTKGETLLDMGQNMVGWLAFTVHAPGGTQIKLQFGEVLQNGTFYRDNLRTAHCEYRYTSDGHAKTVCPCFTFYGFRYVKLCGFPGDVRIEDFTGLVLHTRMRETGRIVTGHAKVNRLVQNVLWGQRGNFLDTPTDCPQRDERMGWTGDAQVFFGTAAFNMDVYAFFAKYCHDLMQEQKALYGDVPVVVPKHDVVQTGACGWGDAATIIPWNLYVRYGDIELLRALYPSMRAWVEHVRSRDDGSRLWRGDFHFGDWLSLDVNDPINNRFGGTEHVYLASCFYCCSARLVAKAAAVLGYEQDAKAYGRLSAEIKKAILREYVTRTGRLAVSTQTAYVLALHLDILPKKWREKAAHALRLTLKASGYHLQTGFLGTPYLCRVLSDNGSNDIAYRLLLQEDYPSWLYQVNMGATTVWERWNSILPDGTISDTGMNSLNHYAYGSIVEWLYQNAAGIQPLEAYPGFRRFRLAPQPDRSLGSLSAVFHSPAGVIRSEWSYEDNDTVAFRFSIPMGSKAEMCLPDGVRALLSGGTYSFVCHEKPANDADRPIREIYESPAEAKAFAEKHPALSRMILFEMLAGERSLNDLSEEGFDIEKAQP